MGCSTAAPVPCRTLSAPVCFPCKEQENREPPSGLEPLTPAHYECAVSSCRGVQGLANPAYLSRFPFSALPCVAPYCVPSGVRVVSEWCQSGVKTSRITRGACLLIMSIALTLRRSAWETRGVPEGEPPQLRSTRNVGPSPSLQRSPPCTAQSKVLP